MNWLCIEKGRNFLLFLGLVVPCMFLLASCNSVGDYREEATAGPENDQSVNNAAGISQITYSNDSENLFFCPSTDGAWGLFSSNRHSENFRIYRKNLNSAGFLTIIPGTEEGNNFFPALSSDNSLFAFASDRDGSWRIYAFLINKKGVPQGTPRAVTPVDDDCLCPAWDPSAEQGNERLAFSRYNPREEQWEICILDFKTGGVKYLGPGLFPAWSPEGKYLAIQKERERGAGQFSLWLLRVDGTEPPRILFMSEEYAATNPAWSPDGSFIAFNTVGRKTGGKESCLSSEGGGICYINSRGGNPVGPLGGAKKQSWRPSWSKDGKIYFQKREGVAVNIFSVEGPGQNKFPKLATKL